MITVVIYYCSDVRAGVCGMDSSSCFNTSFIFSACVSADFFTSPFVMPFFIMPVCMGSSMFIGSLICAGTCAGASCCRDDISPATAAVCASSADTHHARLPQTVKTAMNVTFKGPILPSLCPSEPCKPIIAFVLPISARIHVCHIDSHNVLGVLETQLGWDT
jgi:hypothetical protein